VSHPLHGTKIALSKQRLAPVPTQAPHARPRLPSNTQAQARAPPPGQAHPKASHAGQGHARTLPTGQARQLQRKLSRKLDISFDQLDTTAFPFPFLNTIVSLCLYGVVSHPVPGTTPLSLCSQYWGRLVLIKNLLYWWLGK
jgi:hypothetical protein